MKHTTIGDKYINDNEGRRMYARGVMWGYANGVWSYIPNFKHEIWDLCKRLKCSPNSGMVSSVCDYISGALYKDESELDANAELVNLRNGVFNLRTGTLLPHCKDYLLTAQLGFAYEDDAECPQWEKFISDVMVSSQIKTDPSMIEFLQEAFGYSITASTEQEISFWLIGEGANGKSTLLKVLDKLSGSAALHLNLGMLDRDKYQLAELGGKRVIICTESPDTTVSDSVLKAIISGDKMNVRGIFGKPFVVNPIAKVWWGMNNPPRVNDTSEGFWRKTKVIPFNRTFEYEERNKKLIHLLTAELPGIFNWSLIGLKRLETRGYFTECDAIEDATNSYRDESDLPGQFIKERCKRSNNSAEPSSNLYSAFRMWCKENGHRPPSSNRMGREWKRCGLRPEREGQKRIWIGVELLSEDTYDTLIIE